MLGTILTKCSPSVVLSEANGNQSNDKRSKI
jgi:hypothetical protein